MFSCWLCEPVYMCSCYVSNPYRIYIIQLNFGNKCVHEYYGRWLLAKYLQPPSFCRMCYLHLRKNSELALCLQDDRSVQTYQAAETNDGANSTLKLKVTYDIRRIWDTHSSELALPTGMEVRLVSKYPTIRCIYWIQYYIPLQFNTH